MDKNELVLVTGAGGFIGGHLVAALRQQGHRRLRAVDIKPLDEWYQHFDDVENRDPRPARQERVRRRMPGRQVRLQPGRRHGRHGIHRAEQGALHVVRADQHAPAAWPRATPASTLLLLLVRLRLCRREADVAAVTPLTEADAYPAMPEDGYGWEKLFSERMCRHFTEDFGLETRVARYHNVYGPHGTYDGGREKAPAAICRKVISAQLTGGRRDRDLGRRRADAQLHLHRRLPGGHAAPDAQRRRRAAQHRQRANWSRSISSSTSSKRSPA